MKNVIVGATVGDPAGIGPEVIGKLLLDEGFRKEYPFVPVTPKFVMDNMFQNVLHLPSPEYDYIPVPEIEPFEIVYGHSSPLYGDTAMKTIKTAVESIQNGKIQAMATAPIHKASILMAGYPYPGHTEYLGALTNSSHFSMMLASPTLRVIPVTVHIPLKDVAAALTTGAILQAIQNAHGAGPLFGLQRPRIAVSALNPHAGEDSRIGVEEQTIIIPAITQALKMGIDASGPHPADSMFAFPHMFDIAVCMYHDQALIPLKMGGFGHAVNITLNLPVIRTSVDHGTAFDIAGKGVANPESMRLAIIMAHHIVAKRV